MLESALLHGIHPGEPGWVDRLLAFHRSTFGDALMEDGVGAGGSGGTDGADGANTTGGAGGGDGATDTGFPANTPIVEMTTEQQAAYWKHQARKHEQRASERADYDDLKAKAAKFDEAQRNAMTEHEKAIEEARASAKEEGRSEALVQANRVAVNALIDGALRGRGRTPEQITKLTAHINPDSFVKDGAPDTEAIIALADDIAGPVTGGGRGPDHGQGHRGTGTKASGIAAGAEMWVASRGSKTTTP